MNTQRSSPEKSRPDRHFLERALIAGFVALVILVVRAAGFSAISDDDYARLVIAQEFVEAPRWDPSGTSWLPFPFLLTGTAMMLLGATLQVGLWVQFAATICGAWLLHAVSRTWGAERRGALLGVALCCLTPSAAFLEAAAVPGFLTAALLTFAFAHCRPEHALRSGACLLLACASRYEAWVPSGVAALYFLWDARDARKRQASARTHLAAALLAVGFPAFWMAYGSIHHHDAFFFVKRVVDYKSALGDSLPTWPQVLSGYPRLLWVAEPELTLSATLLLVSQGAARGWIAQRADLSPLSRWLRGQDGRAFWLYCFLLLALVLGAARGGAPTHHPERALLSIWLGLGLLLGRALERCFHDRRAAAFGCSAAALAFVLSFFVRSQDLWQREPLAQRSAEEKVGTFVRKHAPSEAIALALPDYGYFAVMAAAGSPGRFSILESHDPRLVTPTKDPLMTWLQHPEHCAYVTTRERPHITPRVLAVESEVMFAREMRCVPQALSGRADAMHH